MLESLEEIPVKSRCGFARTPVKVAVKTAPYLGPRTLLALDIELAVDAVGHI
jgi:hypothetical protein